MSVVRGAAARQLMARVRVQHAPHPLPHHPKRAVSTPLKPPTLRTRRDTAPPCIPAGRFGVVVHLQRLEDAEGRSW